MKPNGNAWRHGRARKDLSYIEAAERLRIVPRYLLNIESNQPSASPSNRLIYRAARLYGLEYGDLVRAEEEETPPADPPAKKPERKPSGDPSAPPPRRNGNRDNRGPRREQQMRASA